MKYGDILTTATVQISKKFLPKWYLSIVKAFKVTYVSAAEPG
jgi:hypothetical protein